MRSPGIQAAERSSQEDPFPKPNLDNAPSVQPCRQLAATSISGHTLATDPFLNALRSSFSPVPSRIVSANARILQVLDQPIPMRFPSKAGLDDVLEYIKKATTTPTYRGIPIYVDPLGLQEAGHSLSSMVSTDLDDVPLKTTLRLCLKQLGLDYRAKDGYLLITNADAASWSLEDPFLIVGHCLLALLAAAPGGAAAPLISDARGTPPGRAPAEDAPIPAPSSKD